MFPGNARLQPGPYYHSRGYLPHLDIPEAIQHVTYHLADSLPREVLERMKEGERRDMCQAGAWRSDWDDYLDAGYGSCILREPVIAEIVQQSFLHFDGVRYRLFAWVVMPNHVHVLFQPLGEWTVAKVVASWKSFAGRRIGEFMRGSGRDGDVCQAGDWRSLGASRIWHREYWDRFIRDQRHFETVVQYIHENPVKAGLVTKAEEWVWSSAGISG